MTRFVGSPADRVEEPECEEKNGRVRRDARDPVGHRVLELAGAGPRTFGVVESIAAAAVPY